MIAPAVRDRYDISLSVVSTAFSALWVGTAVTLMLWGLAADRFGERLVLASGLAASAVFAAGAAYAPSFALFAVLLFLAGAAGASVNSASGRAVMHWFGPDERGLALGVRQTAIPIGGLVAALLLPPVEHAGGLEAAFLVLAGLCALGAAAGAMIVREREADGIEPEAVPWTVRDPRLWRLSLASGGYLAAQIAVMSFVVLFLHDARGFSNAAAAGVLAGVQVLAGGLRIGIGRWSDVLGTRIVPLRQVGIAIVVTLGAAAALVHAPAAALVPAFVVAGGLAMAWNGLSFTAAAELAGRSRSGAALGLQQTVLALVGVAVPPVFATVVDASSWQAAFALSALPPLVAWYWLKPLETVSK